MLVGGLFFYFYTRSDLWLDEALSVNIARLPLVDLHEALRHDGAPPLYYVLLHFWTARLRHRRRRGAVAVRRVHGRARSSRRGSRRGGSAGATVAWSTA